ncbi:hypothetical protein EC973_005112 [Apophysomyces ossiformis]|uniref:Uncharacterized protein n=1 Tax=Apophysomyces ossiformis TaxID=679940 RepID=A0A8H7BKK6_9FUNG|nr:hypothetical protein EC973_005112 [Apophysomyces ossiformis]
MTPLTVIPKESKEPSLSYATVANNIKEIRNCAVSLNIDAFIKSESLQLPWQDDEPLHDSKHVSTEKTLETLHEWKASNTKITATDDASQALQTDCRELVQEYITMNNKLPQLRADISRTLQDMDTVHQSLEKTKAEIRKGNLIN